MPIKILEVFVGGLMGLEIIKKIKDSGLELESHIKIENGILTHRQIETRSGKTFMRIKTRRLFEIGV